MGMRAARAMNWNENIILIVILFCFWCATEFFTRPSIVSLRAMRYIVPFHLVMHAHSIFLIFGWLFGLFHSSRTSAPISTEICSISLVLWRARWLIPWRTHISSLIFAPKTMNVILVGMLPLLTRYTCDSHYEPRTMANHAFVRRQFNMNSLCDSFAACVVSNGIYIKYDIRCINMSTFVCK